jgi:ribonuclease HII
MISQRLKDIERTVQSGPPYETAFLDALRLDTRVGAQRCYQRCINRVAQVEKEAKRLEAMLQFERQAKANGFHQIAGVDEAGRGPLAGPIVAAAVILSGVVSGLNDSKKLTEAQRDTLFGILIAGRHNIGVAVIEAEQIDRIGIQGANYGAMAQAVAQLAPPADYLLVDGFALAGVTQPAERLVKGDQRSLSIAAASIVAKVTRDRIMVSVDKEYPEYGFRHHKGYGTREHLLALERFGPCKAHRRTFAPISRMVDTEALFE